MSSFADNKHVSESKQEQKQLLEKEQKYQLYQQTATTTATTTTSETLQQTATKKQQQPQPQFAEKSETFNKQAIATNSTQIPVKEATKVCKSTTSGEKESDGLNKTTNVSTVGNQKSSLLLAPFAAAKAGESSKMPPGDAVQQVAYELRKFMQSEKDNQSLTNVSRTSDSTVSAKNDLIESTSLSTESSTPTTAFTPLSTLPAGFSSLFGPQLPHICSEPTFGVQMRKKQAEQNKSNETVEKSETYPSSGGIKVGTVSESSSPNMVRKSSDCTVSLPRRVSFPKSDNELVTGYLEPANPWVHVCMVKSISEIAELYMTSCHKHNTNPLQCVLDHLKAVDLTKQLRQPLLSLKSIPLAPSDCEALEEVLKRVQYKSIDLSDCKLNEIAASALFEMIEYYEATNELDISSNTLGMTHRGWLSCTYMISHSQELQVLNAQGNPISKLSADHLGNALNTSNLHTLKLEHCNLKGAPLSGLCFKLWHNRVLKELWIAYNELDSNDADTIAEMLKVNHFLELIDISNNNIGDDGLRHIVLSLIMQSKELERRTTFQRAAAIDDDESMSPFESSAPVDLCDSEGIVSGLDSGDWRDSNDSKSSKATKDNEPTEVRVVKCKKPLSTIDEKHKSVTNASDVTIASKQATVISELSSKPVTSFKPPLISTVGSTIEEIDPDEDSDETVRLCTMKNGSAGGQSMLDKLLSMNSESSSEEGVSNLSTDTLAACCSEDASLISDDIFDVSAPATTTITIANANVRSPALGDREGSAGTVCAISIPVTSPSVAKSSLQCSPRDEDKFAVNEKGSVTTLTEALNTVLIELPAVLPTTTSIETQPSNAATAHINNNGNNNNNNNNNAGDNVISTSHATTCSSSVFAGNAGDHIISTAGIYELKADDRHCMLGGAVGVVSGSVETRENDDHTNALPHLSASKALDVNKNTKLGEDFDDTHSTDSAFESASEGDISRHLPEEFTRLSASLESTRLDDIAKEFSIETATIASESNECLIAAAVHVTPSSTPTPQIMPLTQISNLLMERDRLPIEPLTASTDDTTSPTKQVGFCVVEQTTEGENEALREKMPKVTIAQDSLAQKYKTNNVVSTSPSQTPPPPSTSPGGVSSGLRRTESTCAFLTQSTRNRSQSTDSLCSDNSLDGSIGSGDLSFSSTAQLNEKLTKNDTLTRQQRQQESAAEASARTPGGLKALALWNNNLSKEAGLFISNLLAETVSLELLNIGKNCLTNDFVASIKDNLTKNTTLTTLGLQSAHLSAEGIETLTSIMTFGGNSTLQRIDIRGNKVDVESLTKIAEVLKSNTTVTQIDIDDEPKRLSVGSEAHLDYARVLENVRSMCARNEKNQFQMQQEKASINPLGKRRGGYYLGSRKISLTCHTRPLVDTSNPVLVTCSTTSNSKLDAKRKPGARLRSPVPSPTTISPSSSPNRSSRFQVYRVSEVSPLTSPSIQKHVSGLAGTKAISSSSVFIQSVSSDEGNTVDAVYPNTTSTSLPTSCSLPSMATISSSTQSIKRLSVSPRSRFLVRKIYEDPNVPLGSRTVPPITPPINPPPTPISRNSKEPMIPDPKEAISATQTKLRQKENDQSDIGHTPKIIVPPLTIAPSPPLKSVTQQQKSFTTDSCATSTFNIRELHTTPIIQQCREESTNTKTNDKNTNQLIKAAAVADTTCGSSSSTIQPSPSILSTLSAISSSSSDNSALSSSASSSTSSSSPSSSSSTSPASNIDTTDSSSSSPSVASSIHSVNDPHIVDSQDLTVLGKCPIAVFGDNDITLTKNTVNTALVSAAAASKECTNNIPPEDNSAPPTAAQHQRGRKVSWIANPTAVDKLLTLFHNPFQRSSSPEAKVTIAATSGVSVISGATQLSQTSVDVPALDLEQQQQQQHQQQQQQQPQYLHQQSVSQKNLMPLRKQSPPSWSKLGTDILTAAGSNNVNVELANTVATTAAAVVTEQSRSFLDAASKQFRDFSKQVFRQNLSFGNEAVTTASTTTITSSTVNNPNSGSVTAEDHMMLTGLSDHTGGVMYAGSGVFTGGDEPITCLGPSSFATSSMACNVGSLPTDVKQEIKENISPEHTINEETLHTMQKLGCGTTSSPASMTPTTTASAVVGTSSPTLTSELRQANEDLHKATSWETQTRFGSE